MSHAEPTCSLLTLEDVNAQASKLVEEARSLVQAASRIEETLSGPMPEQADTTPVPPPAGLIGSLHDNMCYLSRRFDQLKSTLYNIEDRLRQPKVASPSVTLSPANGGYAGPATRR